MQVSLLEFLACPDDGNEVLDLENERVQPDTGDVQFGHLICRRCGRSYPIVQGIPSMLPQSLSTLADKPVRAGTCEAGDQINEMRARDQLADKYGRDVVARNHRNRVEVEATLRNLAAAPSDVILDAGAGPGRFELALERSCRAIVALDFSMTSLLLLASRLSQKSRQVVHPVQGDLLNLPLRHDTFDKCLSFGVLEHIPSRAGKHRAIDQLRRVLQPGGRLVVVTYNHNVYARRKGVRTGYHLGRIYFENLTRQEFLEMLQPQLAVEEVSGVYNRLPKGLSDRLGELGYWIDRAMERTPLSNWFAYMLLARCKKKPA
ncbi:MAG: methyltransferase domain-containing protein [Chloroflexi bacterium]|nr:methyltransferase domain-containing protein [Chloroflexota bacterium]